MIWLMWIFHTYVSSTIVAAILIATSIALLAMEDLWRDRVLLVSGTIAILLAAVEVQERVGIAAIFSPWDCCSSPSPRPFLARFATL